MFGDSASACNDTVVFMRGVAPAARP